MFSALALVGAVSTVSAEVRLTIQRGHVTLVAKDATIRQILAEWERVGQTKVVNAERIGGGLLTLELTDVPELQALDVVLRSVSGVVLAPRATAEGNVSAFERIVVVPASIAPAQAANTPPPPAFGASPFPQQAPPFPSDEQDGAALNRGGAVFTFPPPQVTSPQGGQCRASVSRCSRGSRCCSRHRQRPPRRYQSGRFPERQSLLRRQAYPFPEWWHPRRRRQDRRDFLSPRHPRNNLLALVDEVQAAMTGAMRQQAHARLSALRMLKAALMNREVEKGRALDDNESRQVVTSLVKQRRDSVDQFTRGGRQDLADKETAEIAVLESYLPAAADPAVVDRAVAEAIAETGAASAKDIGRVMKAAMAKLSGQNVDGKTVNELVRSKLSGSHS